MLYFFVCFFFLFCCVCCLLVPMYVCIRVYCVFPVVSPLVPGYFFSFFFFSVCMCECVCCVFVLSFFMFTFVFLVFFFFVFLCSIVRVCSSQLQFRFPLSARLYFIGVDVVEFMLQFVILMFCSSSLPVAKQFLLYFSNVSFFLTDFFVRMDVVFFSVLCVSECVLLNTYWGDPSTCWQLLVWHYLFCSSVRIRESSARLSFFY